MWKKTDKKRECSICGKTFRFFDFLTLGVLLHELFHEKPSITRATFYRRVREGKLPFPEIHKKSGGWRVFSRDEADQIKSVLQKDARIG